MKSVFILIALSIFVFAVNLPAVKTSASDVYYNHEYRRVKEIPGPGSGIADADSDGMPDWWENSFSDFNPALDPHADDSQHDPDKDSLVNLDEFLHGTHPYHIDTDADLLDDGAEVHTYGTNPAMADSDGGGKPDGYEVSLGSDPLDPDDDGSSVVSTTLSLSKDWNLISFPIEPVDTSVATVLSPISGSFTVVWAYKNGTWEMYDPNVPGLSDLTNLDSGRGYWIHMSEAAELTVSGHVATSSLSLGNGWNLIGYNSPTIQEVGDALLQVQGKIISVWAFMGGSWKVYDPENQGFNDLTNLEPGYGYWINSKEDITWTLTISPL